MRLPTAWTVAWTLLLLAASTPQVWTDNLVVQTLPGSGVLETETFSGQPKWRLQHLWTEKTVNVSCPGSTVCRCHCQSLCPAVHLTPMHCIAGVIQIPCALLHAWSLLCAMCFCPLCMLRQITAGHPRGVVSGWSSRLQVSAAQQCKCRISPCTKQLIPSSWQRPFQRSSRPGAASAASWRGTQLSV